MPKLNKLIIYHIINLAVHKRQAAESRFPGHHFLTHLQEAVIFCLARYLLEIALINEL